jgi:hypothetical protein
MLARIAFLIVIPGTDASPCGALFAPWHRPAVHHDGHGLCLLYAVRHTLACPRHPRLYVLGRSQDLNGRDKPGHDGCDILARRANHLFRKTEVRLRFVKPILTKYSGLQKQQITLKQFLSCPDERGVTRTCRTRGGMRWTRAASLTNGAACGRQSRGGLAPRRWCLACGTQFPQMMVANKPGTPRRPRRSC